MLAAVACRAQLHDRGTRALFANLAVANLAQAAAVLPATFAVLILNNWVFGRTLCYCLPMMQDIPLHVTMLTFVLLATDRYRLVLYPYKPRVPLCICAMGSWLLAVCIVVPYPFYLTYLDLGLLWKPLEGTGFCIVNLVASMQDYMRGLFLFTYVLPLSTMAYLFVRVSQELKTQGGPLAVMMYEARGRDEHGRSHSACHSYRSDRCGLYDAELDVVEEKRAHKYLVLMVSAFGFWLCPLMVLRVVRQVLPETYENDAHLDVTYTVFVWFAFLHTCSTPALYASWTLSPLEKERLRLYFRFGERRRLRNRSQSALGAVVQQQQQQPPPEAGLESPEDEEEDGEEPEEEVEEEPEGKS
ncbi:prolactin-releasing peptide receptor-like [Schistocerca nitens]|uniref:prolactin-releasing peptide receptor-like n=1 Tax=Schistocerca nitens TaxID=7011 RepID=UPI0021181470|nr:prolactin-releasing peptide receptor-like [Schistocerca nitens]